MEFVRVPPPDVEKQLQAARVTQVAQTKRNTAIASRRRLPRCSSDNALSSFRSSRRRDLSTNGSRRIIEANCTSADALSALLAHRLMNECSDDGSPVRAVRKRMPTIWGPQPPSIDTRGSSVAQRRTASAGATFSGQDAATAARYSGADQGLARGCQPNA